MVQGGILRNGRTFITAIYYGYYGDITAILRNITEILRRFFYRTKGMEKILVKFRPKIIFYVKNTICQILWQFGLIVGSAMTDMALYSIMEAN